MKKIIFRRFPITGLLLAAVSGVTLAVSTKHDAKIENNDGMLVISGDGLDHTCVTVSPQDNACTVTRGDGTRTSTNNEGDTSSFTSLIGKNRTLTSVFNGFVDVITTSRVHTSEDADNNM